MRCVCAQIRNIISGLHVCVYPVKFAANPWIEMSAGFIEGLRPVLKLEQENAVVQGYAVFEFLYFVCSKCLE